MNRLLRLFHLGEMVWTHDMALPVGISFYTLQALGYLVDVYRGNICAEKNFLKYALFVSFFPQLVAGPIERSNNLLNQLNKPHKFEYENLRKGCIYILYGLFLKMVIADRTSIIVDTVYDGYYAQYTGFYIVVATCFFAIQIYCDFYGYSTIAKGSALIMGIHLMDNFEAPYYAKSVKEFWRRWHISLSGWFRDYLYIPLGGNRKGKKRRVYNLMAVFGISGLWHGAALSYVIWGLLNGAYQVMAEAFMEINLSMQKFFNKLVPGRIVKKDHIDKADNEAGYFSKNLFRTMITFLMVTFTWLFFRAGSLSEGVRIIVKMLSDNNWMIFFDGSLYNLGVEKNYMQILMASIMLLFIVDWHKYKGLDMAEWLLKQGYFFRVLIIMVLLFVILLYGCYGEIYDIQQFIYFQF
ncbi:MAG: MBOAT family protein [Butyrivibrio sp.]|nr:MBOAT family protein [Butyrivibrio sp.]